MPNFHFVEDYEKLVAKLNRTGAEASYSSCFHWIGRNAGW
jgi:hypothetical protein